MNRRDAFFTDEAAVEEMFGKGSRVAEDERMKRNLEALSWLPNEYVGKAVAAPQEL